MPAKKTEVNFAKAFEEYKKIASLYGTKQKYFNYHNEIFELRKKGDMAYHSPSRIDVY